ncbi:MAG: VWA domain-containing protein [Cyanobacteria bacterium REEB67]|nr:VWA domain-containing protein [Cyanobacteria bacterium REEB67]
MPIIKEYNIVTSPRRSPLVKSINPTNKQNAKSLPLTQRQKITHSLKRSAAVATVIASIIGTGSTIAGFAHSIIPIPTLPVVATTNQPGLGPIIVGTMPASTEVQDDDGRPPSGELTAVDALGRATAKCTLKSTSMDARISGYVTRVNVTQEFQNPYDHPIEAIYNFPLSDDAAVYAMTIRIGERVIKATIKTREQAARTYTAAREAGKATALLEQQRTNIFTQKVANIAPGKSIIVQISYVELLKFENGRYTLTMPTKIGPRFFPDGPAQANLVESASRSLARVLGSENLRPNALGEAGNVNDSENQRLSITVAIDAGMKIKNVESKLHKIMIDKTDDSHCNVILSKYNEHPQKDFVLTYEVDDPTQLRSGYVAYKDKKEGYATFMLLPPAKVTPADAAPKEMTFLIDCSGSQAGTPLQKAKEALHYIVNHMNQHDSFQIIAFNQEISTLADAPMIAGFSEKTKAHSFINSLQADGGTWMAPAVERVLRSHHFYIGEPERLRIVTFMTDGFVGNDLEVISMVQKFRQNTRWFVFGTGDNVNHTLIDNVARLGGGEADYVLQTSSAEEVGAKFYSRIAAPALTNVRLSDQGLGLTDIQPGQIGDVWANKPLYFTAKYARAASGTVTLTGLRQGRPYKQVIKVELPEKNSANNAIEKVWARQTIAALEDEDLSGLATKSMQPNLQNRITRVALEHELMSDYTSFVAVDSDGSITPTGKATLPDTSGAPPKTSVIGSPPQQQIQQPVQVGRTLSLPQPVSHGAISMPASAIAAAPQLVGGAPIQGATNGTIGPQGTDCSVIEGVNTAGAVRVNNLANLEAMLNILANFLEILGIACGGTLIMLGFKSGSEGKLAATKIVLFGLLLVASGIACPGVINWLVSTAQVEGLFN